MDPPQPFNPLDKSNLGNSVVDALLDSAPTPLGEVARFSGAGVYAIYYSGSFENYAPLASANSGSPSTPIYVGKAIPRGGRKATSLEASMHSKALSHRLLQHKNSIEAVANLSLSDFCYRAIVVDDIWIPLGEALVIQRFSPLWNTVVDGFGNHDPGKGRHQGKCPLWDELHPGAELGDEMPGSAPRPGRDCGENPCVFSDTPLL